MNIRRISWLYLLDVIHHTIILPRSIQEDENIGHYRSLICNISDRLGSFGQIGVANESFRNEWNGLQ